MKWVHNSLLFKSLDYLTINCEAGETYVLMGEIKYIKLTWKTKTARPVSDAELCDLW